MEHNLEDGWAQFCDHSELKTRGVIKNKGAIKTRGNIINRTRDTINMITARTSLKLGV